MCSDTKRSRASFKSQGWARPSRDENSSRAKTQAEMSYGKVEGESLGIYHGVMSFKMYLYGTKFTVVVDHKPLVSLYNNEARPKQTRVDRHRMKLAGFDFDVLCRDSSSSWLVAQGSIREFIVSMINWFSQLSVAYKARASVCYPHMGVGRDILTQRLIS